MPGHPAGPADRRGQHRRDPIGGLLAAHPQRGGDRVAADDQPGEHAHGGQQHVGDGAGTADLRHQLRQLRIAGQQIAAGRGHPAGDGAERGQHRPASRCSEPRCSRTASASGLPSRGLLAGPEPGREQGEPEVPTIQQPAGDQQGRRGGQHEQAEHREVVVAERLDVVGPALRAEPGQPAQRTLLRRRSPAAA